MLGILATQVLSRFCFQASFKPQSRSVTFTLNIINAFGPAGLGAGLEYFLLILAVNASLGSFECLSRASLF